jgi:hypothetical protein
VKRKLFETAFDVPLDTVQGEEATSNKGTFAGPEIEKIWSAVEKVPHAHVDEHSIRNFIAVTKRPSNNTLGTYDPTNREISIDKASTTTTEKTYDGGTEMTEEQAIAAAGSQADFHTLDNNHQLNKNAQGMYTFRQDDINEFSATVLHEVGHAVDAMLGNKTELVYDLAGWKRFGIDNFEAWAAELGGWELVSSPDQEKIATAWKTWLAGGAKGSVADLVPHAHPAVSEDYALKGVGVIRLAHTKNLPTGVDGPKNLHLMVRAQELYTLSQRGLDAAPTAYALTTPEEYFAECYSVYYSQFVETDGKTPKGQLVVPWIKTWMDKNVDTIGHNPMSAHFSRSKSS